jgi:5-methylthioribose kinase
VLGREDVATYVAGRPELSRWGEVTDVVEIGDGNINNVFRVICHGGTFVLKQSMPYVRIDPSWRLTPTRIDFEAAFYQQWRDTSPLLPPRVYMFDAESHALAVEDLHGHEVWRHELAAGRVHPDAPIEIGRFLAAVALHARPWELPPSLEAQEAEETVNPIMTQLMEDVVFRFPYEDHPHNSFVAEVVPLVEEIRGDAGFRSELETLRSRWRDSREAMIHGDLHTGSVMVAGRAARAIDAEFSTCGPIAWDLGELTGNLLIAELHERIVRPGSSLDDPVGSVWAAFEQRLMDNEPPRQSSATPGALARWLTDVRSDAVGYAGAEMVRRVIGSGKADEVAALAGERHARAVTAMLRAGSDLVQGRAVVAPEQTLALTVGQLDRMVA